MLSHHFEACVLLSALSRLQRMALLSVATALITMALKFWSWQISGSVSLLSDAIESLVNLAAALLAFTVLTIAARPADADHPFGHDKAEYFSSAAEGLLIILAAVGIALTAWGRLFAPEPLQALSWGLYIAAVAAFCNGFTAWKLFTVAKQEDSLTLRASAEHLLSDVWTSVAVIGGLVVLWLWPTQAWLDPAIALAVSLHLLLTGIKLLAPSLAGLMDEALPDIELKALRQAAAALLPANVELSTLRTRKSGHRRFVDANLLVPGELSVAAAHELCDRIEDAMRATLTACDITLHVAPLHERERHL